MMRLEFLDGCDLQELIREEGFSSQKVSQPVWGLSETEKFGGAKAAKKKLLSAGGRLSCDWVISQPLLS